MPEVTPSKESLAELPMATYVAYADGSSLNNPGCGGWAVLLTGTDGTRKTITGSADYATNNVMELTAAIRALQAIPLGATATIRTDSVNAGLIPGQRGGVNAGQCCTVWIS